MSGKAYLITSTVIFALVAALHLVRILNHWSLQIGAVTVPFWGSWLGVVIGAALSVWALRLTTDWTGSHQ